MTTISSKDMNACWPPQQHDRRLTQDEARHMKIWGGTRHIWGRDEVAPRRDSGDTDGQSSSPNRNDTSVRPGPSLSTASAGMRGERATAPVNNADRNMSTTLNSFARPSAPTMPPIQRGSMASSATSTDSSVPSLANQALLQGSAPDFSSPSAASLPRPHRSNGNNTASTLFKYRPRYWPEFVPSSILPIAADERFGRVGYNNDGASSPSSGSGSSGSRRQPQQPPPPPPFIPNLSDSGQYSFTGQYDGIASVHRSGHLAHDAFRNPTSFEDEQDESWQQDLYQQMAKVHLGPNNQTSPHRPATLNAITSAQHSMRSLSTHNHGTSDAGFALNNANRLISTTLPDGRSQYLQSTPDHRYQSHMHMNAQAYLQNGNISPAVNGSTRNGLRHDFSTSDTRNVSLETYQHETGTNSDRPPNTTGHDQPPWFDIRSGPAMAHQSSLAQQHIPYVHHPYTSTMGVSYQNARHVDGQELLPNRVVAPWPKPPKSSLLLEFNRHHKTRKYELKDIYDHIVEFAGDQYGSRFIQAELERANSDDKDRVFNEIKVDALQLMNDLFGNYVIQKMFEHCNQVQKKILAGAIRGHVRDLSVKVYGCRVVQTAFEYILTEQQAELVQELRGGVLQIVQDQNGNHVIQKAIERIPGEHIQFIFDAHRGQVHRLSRNQYGCRVIQRMLEYGDHHVRRMVLDEMYADIPSLITDQFGNYVVQHVINHGEQADRWKVVEAVYDRVLLYAKHKHASNVVEAAITQAEEEQKYKILHMLVAPDASGQTPIESLLKDNYGNYVIQRVMQQLRSHEVRPVIAEVRQHLEKVQATSGSKQHNALKNVVEEIEAKLGDSQACHDATNLATVHTSRSRMISRGGHAPGLQPPHARRRSPASGSIQRHRAGDMSYPPAFGTFR